MFKVYLFLFVSIFFVSEALAKRLNTIYIGAGAGGVMTHRTKANLFGNITDGLKVPSIEVDTPKIDTDVTGLTQGQIDTKIQAEVDKAVDDVMDQARSDEQIDRITSDLKDQVTDKVSELKDNAFVMGYGAMLSLNVGASIALLKFLYLGSEFSYYFTPGLDRNLHGGLNYSTVGHVGFAFGGNAAVYGIGGFTNANFVDGNGDAVSRNGINYGFGIKGMLNNSFSIALELTGTYFNIQDNGIIPTSFDLDSMRNIFTGQVKLAYHIL